MGTPRPGTNRMGRAQSHRGKFARRISTSSPVVASPAAKPPTRSSMPNPPKILPMALASPRGTTRNGNRYASAYRLVAMRIWYAPKEKLCVRYRTVTYRAIISPEKVSF